MSDGRVEVFSPAKINVSLAITGRRADGFHELVSVVAPLAWGDTLTVETGGGVEGFSLTCDDPFVPLGPENLILKAAAAFREATDWTGGGQFTLAKQIPMGAGLGGGSSNAAAALRGLNTLAGEPLDRPALAAVAAKVGSDCALFVYGGPVVMRGRGERVEALPPAGAVRLSGRELLVFKPAFGISTAWAYGRLAAVAPGGYLPAADAEAWLAGWLAADRRPAEELVYNNMEPPAFAKFPALPVLLERLRKDFGLTAGMSGSGSACFALLSEDSPVGKIEAVIREAWGVSAFILRTRLGR